MSVECAFKSDHPNVVEWMDEMQARYAVWGEVTNGLRAEFPNHSPYGRSHGFTLGRKFAGLSGNVSPGVGWRFDKHQDLWVPDKRTREGKDLAGRFEKLSFDVPPMPGMPGTATYANRWYRPGINHRDDYVWVWWGCPADAVRSSDWSRSTFDESIWIESKLSEFYLMREAVTP